MTHGNPLLDDMAKVMTGMMDAAQSAGEEAKTAMRAQGDKFVAEMDLARRDEVEALKALAQSALARVEALEKRVAELESGKD
ncbi:accessory factor UbiK family protein [Ponticaulis sp.]|uniref:accessory factor UbiK family protein n=1 Tax=Ponticaulis sp. TaxID=2020902 RepID=UPI000B67760E|nr:accessory factor UbiK family protein [Ponticaulis sp.]MAJ09163.1 pyrroline-5-carboxylate reductase [Ponticaulis sp.]MDF1678966.1 accessory factor UbiK family protein [Ponticaulis sp.]RPG16947.1 MAG: accessory factor UbiK family protein [Hyphomonadaceae bacterium TMED125]HBH88562.1 pyrroline-5-carboxylate reductase [Hyphomonadaceae bacterium]